MKIRLSLFVLLLILILAPHAFSATVEGRLLQSLDLASPPLDLAVSPDGQRVFVLQDRKLTLFTIQGEQLGSYPLEKKFSHIASQGSNLVLLYGSDLSQVDYLFVEVAYDIDTAGAPAKGPEDAPVTIVVFDDYQCPYCVRLEPVLKQVLQFYPKQVRLVFKNYPLRMHQHARPAAVAALAAERQGKFWEYHDLLFANSQQLGDAKFEELASQLGLDLKQFKKDSADPALAAKVDRDLRDGEEIGLPGTPGVYINGRPLQERSLNGFRGKIEQLLQMQQMN